MRRGRYDGGSMPLTNAEIAAHLAQLARLLQSQGENRFKVAAYRKAADALRSYPEQASALVARGEDLARIPGVGKGISAAIQEILATGELARTQELKESLPQGIDEIAGACEIS